MLPSFLQRFFQSAKQTFIEVVMIPFFWSLRDLPWPQKIKGFLWSFFIVIPPSKAEIQWRLKHIAPPEVREALAKLESDEALQRRLKESHRRWRWQFLGIVILTLILILTLGIIKLP